MSEQKQSNFARSLVNYKEQHQKNAENKGVLQAFMAARTLTRARGILFGFKSKGGKANRS